MLLRAVVNLSKCNVIDYAIVVGSNVYDER